MWIIRQRLLIAALGGMFSVLFPAPDRNVEGSWYTPSQRDLCVGQILTTQYGIPHGEPSCSTISPVVRYKAQNPAVVAQLARLAPLIGIDPTGDDSDDTLAVGNYIDGLLDFMNLRTLLSRLGFPSSLPDVRAIARRATNEIKERDYDFVVGILRALY
jgi:hypothetical protein